MKLFDSIGPQGLYYVVRDAAKRAGLPHLAPHDLRRTAAKLSRAGGATVEQISIVLGHSSINTTEMYLGTKLELREGLAAFDQIRLDEKKEKDA